MSESLEQRTLRYWRLSRKWNGQTPNAPKIKVQTALKQLKDIHAITRQDRMLNGLSASLADEMIIGGQTKKPSKAIQETAPVGQLESIQ